jgi:hypothetical protein
VKGGGIVLRHGGVDGGFGKASALMQVVKIGPWKTTTSGICARGVC